MEGFRKRRRGTVVQEVRWSNQRGVKLAFAAGNEEGVADHELKVVVVVNDWGKPLVVLQELLPRDFRLAGLVPGRHELGHSLLNGHLAVHNLRVVGHIVLADDFIGRDLA